MQLFFILPCYNELMIYTYCNFSVSFLVLISDDIYIPQLYFILPCYNELMIYTYRNFSVSFLVLISDDIYIPQLYFILPCYNELMIYTYCNFSFLEILFICLNLVWSSPCGSANTLVLPHGCGAISEACVFAVRITWSR